MLSLEHLLQFFEAEMASPGQTVRADTTFKQLGQWSSLNALVLLVEIEKHTGYMLTAQELNGVNTIRELHQLILNKQGA